MFLYKGTYQFDVKNSVILAPEGTSPTLTSSTEEQAAQKQASQAAQERGDINTGATNVKKQKLGKTKSEGLKKEKKRTAAVAVVGRENGRSHSVSAVTTETTKHTPAQTSVETLIPPTNSNRHRTVPITPLIGDKDGNSSPKICTPKRKTLDSSVRASRMVSFSHNLPNLGHLKLSRPVCGPHITFHVV